MKNIFIFSTIVAICVICIAMNANTDANQEGVKVADKHLEEPD